MPREKLARPDLHERLTNGIVKMNAERRASAFHRAHQLYNTVLILCLGSGRCMFPADGDEDGGRVCPFCLVYDENRTHTDVHAARTVDRFVKGN